MNFSQLSFGFFALKIYGILLAVGFVIASWHYYKALQKKSLPVDFFLHNFWKWLLGGMVLGRLVGLFLDPSIFGRNGLFSFFTFWDGQIHFFGAFLGFLGVMWWSCHKEKLDFWRFLDVGVVPFSLCLLIVDAAGFLTGAIYGSPTNLPWGIQYETFGVDILTKVHPVTLYALGLHFWMYKWVKKHVQPYEASAGKLALKGGLFFFGIDFLLQFFRGDSTLLIGGIVRIEQVFALIAFGILFWYARRRRIQ